MSDEKHIETFLGETRSFDPPKAFVDAARVKSKAEYERLYRESLDAPDTFWKRELAELSLRTPWTSISEWKLPHAKWFVGATLNATESCLDRHLKTATKSKRAIVWEGEPESGAAETRTLTYEQLFDQVVRFSAVLRGAGVKKGDRVAIYMGMVPEVVVAMLACARVGATHTVVFGGFAADSLRDRINDAGAKVVVTQDGAYRRGGVVPLKETVDRAVAETPSVEKVIVFRRLGEARVKLDMKPGRDVDWDDAMRGAKAEDGKNPEIVDAEHPLFILYTSGSTGKPKGVLHSTLGYLAGAFVSTKYSFDLKDEDLYWCTADVGWVTGHSYIVYGPLSNGATCMMYEGAPNFPDWGRFWRIIDKHKVTILYTAPTAIRAFIRAGNDWVDKADLSSLRLIGSVGEPINPEAWIWYHEHVGRKKCPVIDTWWQTETGSIMMTTLPAAVPAKPGSTGLPFFGVEPDVVTKDGKSVDAGAGFLVLKRPWPSILRTVWGDDERFRKQYFSEIPGVYFTGDGARRDKDGYFTVVGRIDDVLNVAGHRIGTAEIESALVSHPAVAEAAAVGKPDDLKGQALVVFVTLKPGNQPSPEMKTKLMEHVGGEIGRFARPDEVRFADGLPKTRSGKIMRRLLKDVAAGREATGDTSTLEDLSVLAKLRADEE